MYISCIKIFSDVIFFGVPVETKKTLQDLYILTL